MAAKQTTQILKRLRSLMKDTTFVTEAIQAYIVPSGDAHQVGWSFVSILIF
jgi:Xaa-Pro aminopeptidase